MPHGTFDGLHYTAAQWPPAPGRPTLVFLHGSGGTSLLWSEQVDGLADVANTVALDLPGHGGSGTRGCASVADYARAVAGFLQAAQLPRPIPCGLSIGGAITLQLLLDFPTECAAGILVSTGARLKVHPMIFAAIAQNYPAFVASIPAVAASPQTPPARLAALMAASLQTPAAVTAGDFRACDQFDVMARLGEIGCPVLIVSGADDHLTPPPYARYLEQHIPGARRTHLEACGHLLPLEQPTAFNAAVRSFCAALPAP